MRPATFQSQRSNPLTGSTEATSIASLDRHGKPLRNVCWLDSGFIGIDPIPIDDVTKFYKSEYRQEYKGSFSPQKRHVLRAARCALDRLHLINKYSPQKLSQSAISTLDAGSSSGEFVFLMKQLGYQASGIEPHFGYATYAQEQLGLNIHNCAFSEFSPKEKTFELITLFHVLEHLEFPVADLERLAAGLTDTGIFVIEVPNILYRGMKFSHKWHKGHLSGFSVQTLEIAAARAGLKAVFCGEIGDGGNLFGVFQRSYPISESEAGMRLSSHFQDATQALKLNSSFDYYLRAQTWTKIPKKFARQIEERRTSNNYLSGRQLLESVFGDPRKILSPQIKADETSEVVSKKESPIR